MTNFAFSSHLGDGYTDIPPGKIAAVVTYLEMREPPRRDAAPSPEGFTVVLHRPVDCDWYLRLFRAVGEEWLWFGRLRMSREELSDTLNDERVDVYSLDENGREVGLLEIDRRAWPDVQLAYIGVTRDVMGRGAGRYLMDFAVHQVWEAEPRCLFLHTCTLDHPRALPFYLASGFRAYRRAIEVADDPRLDGLLPRTAAPQVPIIER